MRQPQVFETAPERMAAGRPVGDAFLPLAAEGPLRDMVFPADHAAGASSSYAPHK